jgi:hypothetical protein
MSSTHLTYLKERGTTWFNPCYGLLGFWNEYQKLKEKLNCDDNVYLWNHRDLKRAKEIYATSIIAKITEIQEGVGRWWIHKPKSDPPDGVIGTMANKGSGEKMYTREVEVVEHLSGEILDTIRNKLKGKYYELNTVLVCFVSGGGVYNFQKASETIVKEATNLEHIFLVFHGAELLKDLNTDGLSGQISLVQIKPIYCIHTVDLGGIFEECKNGKEPGYYIFDGIGSGGARAITMEKPPVLF